MKWQRFIGGNMGNIKKVLHETELEQRTITPSSMWGDLCENIHIHIRNLRVEFSKEEFDNLLSAINILANGVGKGIKEGWKPGDKSFLISYDNKVRLKRSSDYYPNRLRIELEKNNDIHIHYREIRLHLTTPEFRTIANAFVEALKNLGDDE